MEISRPAQNASAPGRPVLGLSDVTEAVSAVAKSVLGFLPEAKQV